MSLTLALSSAISGLSTAQKGLDVISNNIANVNTEGFTRKVFVPESVVLAGNGAGVQVGDIINNVDQNLLKDLRSQHSATGLLNTQNTYYRRIQDTFGTVQSADSISNQINNMSKEFSTLTATPETVSQQLAAIQAGTATSDQLANMAQTVQTLRLNADRAIQDQMATINSYLNTIQSLNEQISLNAATNKPTSDLEDKRDVALTKLSDQLDIKYFTNANGSVTVFTSDGTTLVDNAAVTLSHVALTQVSPSASYAGGDFNGIFAGVRDITTAIRSGQIKGLIDMRDSQLPDMQAQLDELSRSLITQVNQVHNRGTSYPNVVNSLTGTRSFMSSSTQNVTISGAEPTVMLYDTSGKELASSRVLDPAGINFTNGGTIDQLASSMQTWIQAQDPQLANATVSVNADGHMQISLGTDTVGIAFQDQESTIKGSAQKDATMGLDLDGDGTVDKSYQGFSNFLGLNDYFTTARNLTQWDSALKPTGYALGIPSAQTLSFADASNPTGIPGGTITVNPADSLENIRDKINSNAALQGTVSAEVVPEGSGQRLRIRQLTGQQLAITQVGGTNAIDTLGLDYSSNGYAQAMAVAQPLKDDSSRVSRGQIQLDSMTGKYLLAPGDNAVASQLAQLFTNPATFQPAGSLSGTNLSFSDYAASIISRSSTQAAATQSQLTVQQDLSNSLDQKQSENSGVNLDEEMSQLLVYQQTYAASAKVISTTQQLFEVLNSMIQ